MFNYCILHFFDHEGQFARFASIFRNLPVGERERIPGIGAPVAGKTLQWGGKRYYYFINNSFRDQTILIDKSLFSGALHPIGASPDFRMIKRAINLLGSDLINWWHGHVLQEEIRLTGINVFKD